MLRVVFTIIAIVLAPVLNAQILSNEEEIFNMMMSSKYYYGDNTSTFDSVAKSNALSDLMTRNKGAYINPKDVVYYYYIFGVGGENYIRVAAFAEKDKQTETIHTEKQNQHKDNPKDLGTTKTDKTIGHAGNPNEDVSLFENMMQYTDLSSMIEYMERLKATRRITDYGPYKNCKNQSTVCWAVFDSKSMLIAILGANMDSRYNYMTKQPDYLDNYIKASNKLLWFSTND